MYCMNCGVKLADTEKRCPLCQTRVYHPDIERPEVSSLYPPSRFPGRRHRSRLPQIIITAACMLASVIMILCDNQFDHQIMWAHYAVGGLLLLYVAAVLPSWFRSPNPIIFVPCSFAAVIAYLLMINLCTGGHWFLTFALPVVGGLGAIVTATVTLTWVLRRGKLFIFGGMCLALGGLAVLMEWLLSVTFSIAYIGWSLYPLVTLVMVGGLLIFIGICRPVRETMERKFFV